MNYLWKANFSDGSSLSQFDSKNDEVKFAAVEARLSELVSFRLVGVTDYYEADLTNGLISHDGNVIDSTFSGKTGLGIVYKRRNKVRFTLSGEQLSSRVTHLLGLAWKTDDAVVHVFPGLEMAEAKIEVKYRKAKKPNKDITLLIKNKEL